MNNQPFIKIFSLYLSFTWFYTISFSVLPVYILNKGYTINQLFITGIFSFLAQLLFILCFKTLKAKLFWNLAGILTLLYVLGIYLMRNSSQLYFFSFIRGLITPLFYICFNVIYFKLVSQEKRSQGGALMFNAPILIGLLAPLIAGYLVEVNILFLLPFILLSFLLNWYVTHTQNDFTIKYHLKEIITAVKETKILIFLQGFWESLIFIIIPIYSLFFIKSPIWYGTFIAYLSFISIIANFFLGKLSDKIGKRIIFLYPLTIFLSLNTFLFSRALYNFQLWVILTSCVQFFLPLFWNLATVLVVDQNANLSHSLPGREIFLVIGRLIGTTIAITCYITIKNLIPMFYLLSFIILLYPLYILFNNKFSQKYIYR